MLKVAIIITVLDGDDRSTGCLAECQRQVDAVAAGGKYSFSIFLNDEGPGGYQAARDKALKDGADFYLWIDSDLLMAENAIACLLENSEFLRHKAVISGTVARMDKSLFLGGRTRRGRLIEPDPTIPVPCYLYDMAFTLVPEYAFTRLENPSDFFRQSLLYYGYGGKVARAGVARVVAPGILARTARAAEIPVLRNPDSTLKERLLWIARSIFR